MSYMGGTRERNKRAGGALIGPRSNGMEEREKISTGPNARPRNETIAGTGPGIPDDTLAPGQDELPQPPTDEQVEETARKLGAEKRERDTLPLQGQ